MPIHAIIVAVKNLDSQLEQRMATEYNIAPHNIIQIPNSAGRGICAKYNRGIERVLEHKTDQDWVVFSHDDVVLKTNPDQVCKSLEEIGTKGAEIACAAGNVGIPAINPGYWWDGLTTAQFRGSGAVVHRTPETEGVFHIESYGPYPQQVAVFDGLWFAVKIGALHNSKLRFEENFPGYHYYDADFCATARSLDFQIWTADVLVLHDKWGRGIQDLSFGEHQKLFIEKWSKQKHLYYKGGITGGSNAFIKGTTAFK